ncbi:MAG: hypothetical protein FWC16_09900 [Defluviitaleaceae bacterium]|nr:hypothetical protein [Defluviitaleaceae bacterium]MCL2275227.1 hypothetical protein [Defluviitaleaceae bacterium]
MKKFLLMFGMAALLGVGLTACGGNGSNGSNGVGVIVDGDDYSFDNDFDYDSDLDFDLDGGFGFGGDDWVFNEGNPDATLVSLVSQLHDNFDAAFIPMRFDVELTAQNFERYLMIEYIEGITGVISEAVINVHPHVVVLMEVSEGMDASAIAAQIEAAADPSRWICVTAEAFEVVAYGNYIVFVMSWADVVTGVVGNIPTVLA